MGVCWDLRAEALGSFNGMLSAPEESRGKCVYLCTHSPPPSQICLGRTPQHRLAGPSHTKPSLQPPAQLCSPLSIGGGAEMRRGAVCPGVGKRAAKQLFCSAGPRGWRSPQHLLPHWPSSSSHWPPTEPGSEWKPSRKQGLISTRDPHTGALPGGSYLCIPRTRK